MCTFIVNSAVLKVSSINVKALSCNKSDGTTWRYLPSGISFLLLRAYGPQSLNLWVFSRQMTVALLPKTAAAPRLKYHITYQQAIFVEIRTSICEKRIPLLFVCISVRYSWRVCILFYFGFWRTQTRVGYKLTSSWGTSAGWRPKWLLNTCALLAHVLYCERMSSFLIFASLEMNT